MTVPRDDSAVDSDLPRPKLAWAFLLDVDGTLVDIGPTPRGVQVPSSSRAVIDALFAATGGAVALVTGRALSDFYYLYPRCKIPLSGQHGVEWRNVDGLGKEVCARIERLDPAREVLTMGVSGRPGLLLEDKGFTIALHYRLVPGLSAFSHRLMRSAQKAVGEEFVVQRGKSVIELKPAAVNKGQAVLRLMSLTPFSGRRPVFVGDDVTDEDAFCAVNQLGGVSIKIGRGRTRARWRLHNTSELLRWLTTAE
ncbi:MAG: trehalose-phosphatase [Gemmatimonadota bacterium]